MELKLNIYTTKSCRELEKTYVSDDFKLSVGVAEDILDLIDIDLFVGDMDEGQQMLQLIKTVIKGKSAFKDIVKNIFEGITDDELGRTDIREFCKVLYDAVVYTIAGIIEVSPEKN